MRIPPPQNRAAAVRAASLPARREAAPSRLGDLVWTLLVGLLAAALCAPFLHSVFWLGDEGVLLGGGERLLHGGRLYIDFFEFLPPGGFVITAAWLAAAGISLLSARVLAVLTIAGIACFTYLACREACRNRLYPALVVIVWLVTTQGYWTEISHHWFTTLLAMIAAWAALRDGNRAERALSEPIIAGLAAGVAVMVVPTRGALAMLAGLIAFSESFGSRRQLSYVLASLVVPTGLFAYIVATGALGAAFEDVIVFPASQYGSLNATPYGYFVNLQTYPLLLLFPVTALLALFAYRRQSRAGQEQALLRSAAAFAVAGFVGCFPRPDVAHLGFAAPLACPLLVYAAKRVTAGPLRVCRIPAAAFAAILCLPSGIAYGLISQRALHVETVQMARGQVAFLDDARPVGGLAAKIGASPAGDAFFFYPLMPLLSFLTGREQVSKYDVFTPSYTLPSQYYDACRAVITQASWLVVDRNWIDASFLRKIFPGLRNPEREEARRFEAALHAGFGLVMRSGPFELRHRDKLLDERSCDAIADQSLPR